VHLNYANASRNFARAMPCIELWHISKRTASQPKEIQSGDRELNAKTNKSADTLPKKMGVRGYRCTQKKDVVNVYIYTLVLIFSVLIKLQKTMNKIIYKDKIVAYVPRINT